MGLLIYRFLFSINIYLSPTLLSNSTTLCLKVTLSLLKGGKTEHRLQ